MRRERDGQDERAPRAGRNSEAFCLLHRRHLTREHELHVGVAVGDPQPSVLRSLDSDPLDLRFIEPDDRDHPDMGSRGLGHDAPALLDEEQRGLPRDRTGGGQRRDLAQAVACGHAHVFQPVAFAPHLVRRPAHRHHAWLDHVGAVQLLDRSFEAQLADRHLEDLFGALEDAARGRVTVVQVLAHAGLLDSLSREEKRDGSGEIYAHVNAIRPTSRVLRPR